jgi:hypothetical protein
VCVSMSINKRELACNTSRPDLAMHKCMYELVSSACMIQQSKGKKEQYSRITGAVTSLTMGLGYTDWLVSSTLVIAILKVNVHRIYTMQLLRLERR